MSMARFLRSLLTTLGAGLALVPGRAFGQGATPASELAAIREQNRLLQQQVQLQQKQIDELRTRLDVLQEAVPATAHPVTATRSVAGSIRLSAEAGLAYFASGDDGLYPNAE